MNKTEYMYYFIKTRGRASLPELMDIHYNGERYSSVSTWISMARELAKKEGKDIKCHRKYKGRVQQIEYEFISEIN